MKNLRWIVLAAAAAALAMCLLAGPGSKYGWWDWRFGIAMMRVAAWAGMAIAAVAAVLVLLLAVPKWRFSPWQPVLALAVALAAVAPPIILLGKARSVPPIHDITTDTADPPPFVALLEARNKSPNGAAYNAAENAPQQQKAYRDIGPKILDQPPREAMQKALDAARAMGWEIAATDIGAGRIEATDTTAWFGFKDDIVIRVRPNGPGSRIDVRSMSRVGKSDLGANAERIRKFLGRL